MIIPHNFENFWSGHFFPFIESWEELQVSFNQICFGLYKQAFVSLRSGLELGMLSVYFNINDDGHNAVKEWLNSKDNTPRAGTLPDTQCQRFTNPKEPIPNASITANYLTV